MLHAWFSPCSWNGADCSSWIWPWRLWVESITLNWAQRSRTEQRAAGPCGWWEWSHSHLCCPADCWLWWGSCSAPFPTRNAGSLEKGSHPHQYQRGRSSLNPAYPCCHAPPPPQFSSVQSLSHVQLFVTPWTAACQAFLSITNSRSLPKLMSTESVMPSNHLIFCRPLLLLPSIFPRIRVFSNESALRIRWPKYWSFSFNIHPSNEHPGLISFRMDWLDLLAIQGTLKSLLQHHSSKASILHMFLIKGLMEGLLWLADLSLLCPPLI